MGEVGVVLWKDYFVDVMMHAGLEQMGRRWPRMTIDYSCIVCMMHIYFCRRNKRICGKKKKEDKSFLGQNVGGRE